MAGIPPGGGERGGRRGGFRGMVWAGLLLTAALGCRGTGASGGSADVPGFTRPVAGGVYQQVVNPFPVLDGEGHRILHPFLGGFRSPRPQLLDLDGDGVLELFIQEHSGQVMHFRRDGDDDRGLPRFQVESLHFQGLDVGEWFRFGDLDGDGLPDLVAESRFSHIRYFRNAGPREAPRFAVGADTLRDQEGRPIFSDRQNIPQVADLDCDGTPDLLIGLLDGTLDRYVQVDAAGAPLPRGSTPAPVFRLAEKGFEGIRIVGSFGSMHGANTMALGDFDGDGDQDLFWGDFFERGLLLIENTGSCQGFNFRNVPIPFPPGDPVQTTGYNAPTFGDLTGDGRPDLVMGVLGGAYNPILSGADNLYLLDRSGGAEGGGSPGGLDTSWSLRTRRLIPMIDVGTESIPTLVDLDGNGLLDLLVANKIDPEDPSSSRIDHYENTGTAENPILRFRGALPFGGRFHLAPAFGDLTGDGRPDLILGHWGPGLAYYRNRGPEGFELVDSVFVEITRGSNTVPTLGDLDGDGLLDLLVGKSSGWISHYRNVGTPGEPRFELLDDEFQGIRVGRRSAPLLVDLEGNGRLDLVVGSEAGEVAIFRPGRGGRHPFFRPF